MSDIGIGEVRKFIEKFLTPSIQGIQRDIDALSERADTLARATEKNRDSLMSITDRFISMSGKLGKFQGQIDAFDGRFSAIQREIDELRGGLSDKIELKVRRMVDESRLSRPPLPPSSD